MIYLFKNLKETKLFTFNVNKNIDFIDYLNCHLKLLLLPINDLRSYRKAYKNYLHVILNKRSNNYPIKAILRNDKILTIENISQLRITRWAQENNYEFQNELLVIKKKGFPEIKLYDWKENGDISGVFFEEQYSSLPVRDKEVIDIGANIGDTSIYFALRGAKKVIALEPAPKNFQSAKKNVELNGLSNKVELIMAGCSGKEGSISVSKDKSGVMYSLEQDEQNEIKVPLKTLEEILKSVNTRPCILKIDCEGCEYETVLSATKETLSNFSHIQIEYHFGYKNLKKKLQNCGFDVFISKPQIGHRLYKEARKSFFGYIFAKRKYD